MSQRVLAPGTYWTVFAVLIGLTCLTIGVSFLPVTALWHSAIGLLIAICKASLVLLVFMHLMHSPRLTWLVIGAAVFWLGILCVLTLNDYYSREILPSLGH